MFDLIRVKIVLKLNILVIGERFLMLHDIIKR